MKLFSFFYLKPYSCFKYWFFWHFKIVLFYDFSKFQNAIWPMFDSLFLFPFSYCCISCERGVRNLTEFCIASFWALFSFGYWRKIDYFRWLTAVSFVGAVSTVYFVVTSPTILDAATRVTMELTLGTRRHRWKMETGKGMNIVNKQ